MKTCHALPPFLVRELVRGTLNEDTRRTRDTAMDGKLPVGAVRHDPVVNRVRDWCGRDLWDIGWDQLREIGGQRARGLLELGKPCDDRMKRAANLLLGCEPVPSVIEAVGKPSDSNNERANNRPDDDFGAS